MAMLIGTLMSTVAGTAATTATAGAAAAGAAVSGISLPGILQGVTGILGIMSSLNASEQEADMFEAQAIDAEAQKPLETLNGIERRTSIKQDLLQSVGEQDAAFAASGVDLSFGTPSEARKDAFADADRALTADNATQSSNTLRLDEKAKNYKLRARRARSAGVMSALTSGVGVISSIAQRG
ncbi:hypothetical protein [Pseudovibrio sp. POLY-S9]|uniref:hypothetical protein n=1 Tax=Pseudovibrio sp. POLY-S9 TaxID=1576596 RepID=UPI000708D89A|nr:hypothetical protein [Pseudovibrio sp. POLY-S9]